MCGLLAKVSVYEFVNNWLRPEVMWNILSFVAEDPHKEGIKKSQTHRRVFDKKVKAITSVMKMTENTKVNVKWRWVRPIKGLTETQPYSQLPIYRMNEPPLHSKYDIGITWEENWRTPRYYNNSGRYFSDGDKYKLLYTNKLLHDLWSYNMYNYNTYEITKTTLIALCKANKIKGYTKLFCKYKRNPTNTKLLPNQRHALITTLIKLE